MSKTSPPSYSGEVITGLPGDSYSWQARFFILSHPLFFSPRVARSTSRLEQSTDTGEGGEEEEEEWNSAEREHNVYKMFLLR